MFSVLPLRDSSLRAGFCCQGVASFKALSINNWTWRNSMSLSYLPLHLFQFLLFFFLPKDVMNEKPHAFTISLLYQSFIHFNSKLQGFMNRWMRRINISVGLNSVMNKHASQNISAFVPMECVMKH